MVFKNLNQKTPRFVYRLKYDNRTHSVILAVNPIFISCLSSRVSKDSAVWQFFDGVSNFVFSIERKLKTGNQVCPWCKGKKYYEDEIRQIMTCLCYQCKGTGKSTSEERNKTPLVLLSLKNLFDQLNNLSSENKDFCLMIDKRGGISGSFQKELCRQICKLSEKKKVKIREDIFDFYLYLEGVEDYPAFKKYFESSDAIFEVEQNEGFKIGVKGREFLLKSTAFSKEDFVSEKVLVPEQAIILIVGLSILIEQTKA